MSRALAWLRRLDDDALTGRASSRLVILVPLAVLVGGSSGAATGFVAGMFVGLLPRFAGDYSVIAFPYLGGLAGTLCGAGLGVGLALRRRRHATSIR